MNLYKVSQQQGTITDELRLLINSVGGVFIVSDQQCINFYRVSDEYGCFSNFAASPIEIDGRIWPSVEHYFQAQKFLDFEIQESIRLTKSPMIAARMGRDRKKPLREDWESVKLDLMKQSLVAKFTQHPDMRTVLMSTKQLTIVEHTKNDRFWGDGGDGTGKNVLGQLLMQVRDQLRGGG